MNTLILGDYKLPRLKVKGIKVNLTKDKHDYKSFHKGHNNLNAKK